MGKDYGKRLKVGETPMITQTENYMEKEVLSTEENVANIATPAVAQPMAPIGNYAQRLTGRQQTKGIVIDMPVGNCFLKQGNYFLKQGNCFLKQRY